MTACVSGCTVRGQHLTGVPHEVCTPTCEPRCQKHCGGCRPRQASRGQLCGRCYGRLRAAIVTIPPLVLWIRAQVGTLGSGDAAGPVSGSRNPPAPINLAAVDDADALHVVLVSWCLTVVDHHPDRLRGPDLSGGRWAVGRIRLEAGVPVLMHPGRVAGLGQVVVARDPAMPVRATRVTTSLGYEAGLGYDNAMVTFTANRLDGRGVFRDDATFGRPVATERAAAWLLTWSDWIAEQWWAGEAVAELTRLVAGAERRWPRLDGPRRSPTPCPACNRRTLVVHGPSYPGASLVVVCDHSACGESVREERFGLLTRMVLDEQRAG